MLAPLRRCPTSIRWRIVSKTVSRNNPIYLAQRPAQASSSPINPRLFLKANAFYSTKTLTRHAQADSAAAVEAEAEQEVKAQQPPSDSRIDDATAMGPITKFADLDQAGLIDRVVVRTLTEKMRLETMTQVQSLTLNEALKGKDVLAQAKTGTGKTIGFLLPVLQNILKEDPGLLKKSQRRAQYGSRAADVRAIVISPTRELAEQIAEEARKLTQDTGVVVQTAVGGTQKSFHLREMQSKGCHILVGTPGRLKDIFSDRETGVSAPRLSAFVLDEADRLLDAGFWPEIQAIQDLLPSKAEKDRQTLMFSATVSQDVVKLVRSAMKPDLHYVRTVQENEEPTHERVPQRLVTVPSLENLLPTLLELCEREATASTNTTPSRPFKAIVYFNATAETTLASSLFMSIRRGTAPQSPSYNRSSASFTGSHLRDTRIYEIHSRLSQRQRTAAADAFRHCTSGVLMSSDVTARGMDFPGVTHVIQVGLPTNRETYIHRLGRTARAGQEGEGWLIIPSAHQHEMRQRLGKMPLARDTSLTSASVDLSTSVAGAAPKGMSEQAREYYDAVFDAAGRVGNEDKEATYMALLGTHQWVRDKEWLVSALNRLATVQWGMSEPPSVGSGLARKMQILGVPGLRVGGGVRGAREEGGFGRGRRDEEGERFESRTRRYQENVGERRGGGGRSGDRFSDRGERKDRFSDRGERSDRRRSDQEKSKRFADLYDRSPRRQTERGRSRY